MQAAEMLRQSIDRLRFVQPERVRVGDLRAEGPLSGLFLCQRLPYGDFIFNHQGGEEK